MITRTYDTTKISLAVSQYPEAFENFQVEDWSRGSSDNIALTNDKGDVALFERSLPDPSTVLGHYFFYSRGRDAIKSAKDFLRELFGERYRVKSVLGLIPKERPEVSWLSKQLGFREIEVMDNDEGSYSLVFLRGTENG